MSSCYVILDNSERMLARLIKLFCLCKCERVISSGTLFKFGNHLNVTQVSLLGLFGYDQSVVSVLCSLISTTLPHGGKDISLIFGFQARSSQLAGPWPRVGPVLQYLRDLAQPSMKIGGLKLIKQFFFIFFLFICCIWKIQM